MGVIVAWPSLDTHGADIFQFEQLPGRMNIRSGDSPVATYVFKDPKIYRPYFAHLHAPNGIQVTRKHPPIEGEDPVDHSHLHPGVWMAFGDLNGRDFWRNRAVIEHGEFMQGPTSAPDSLTFTVSNRYLGADKQPIATERCRYTFLRRPGGYLIVWDSTIEPSAGELVFGDQEEMGLGARLATALTVDKGGTIVNSSGQKNEAGTRGKVTDWLSGSKELDRGETGLTLMAHPDNFRKSWAHSRDYGLVTLNPFARKSLGEGEPSQVRIAAGQNLHLRFGVFLHSSTNGQPVDLKAAFTDFAGR